MKKVDEVELDMDELDALTGGSSVAESAKVGVNVRDRDVNRRGLLGRASSVPGLL